MIQLITSSKNEKYKYYKSLKLKKNRILSGLFTVEGIKSVNDAVEANADIVSILVAESFYSEMKFNYPEASDIFIISDLIFDALSSTQTPQGIIAVIKTENKVFTPTLDNAYIYCDRIQDAGNLGTIIRTADAAGFGGVIVSKDSAEIYNPKTVRSSMGSFFHIPILFDKDINYLNDCKNNGFKIVCGVLADNSVDYTMADLTQPVIIVVGNEANGICDEILNISDINIKIPIDGKAESLNAAVAAAIMMYETNRQRRK